jgi:hypothetical protein
MEIAKIAEKPQQPYYCDACQYGTKNRYDFEKHKTTRKHLNMLPVSAAATITHSFFCKSCNYECGSQDNYDRHVTTPNHLMNRKEPVQYSCDQCSRPFTNRSGLWKHKQKCKKVEEANSAETVPPAASPPITQEMLWETIQKSAELQNFLIDQNKKLMDLATKIQTPVAPTISNNSNTQNNHFNLQIFLNETCKDALNLGDFINSLKLQVEDFETTGKLGYVEGISRIFINALKETEVEKRPLHCTDMKREIVYIKDQNEWTKENEDKERMKQAIDRIAQMNLNQLRKWQEQNPGYNEFNSKKSEEQFHYSMAAMGGRSEKENEKYADKIIKNVIKEVIVAK